MKIDIITQTGEREGHMDLEDRVFGAPIKLDLIARVVRYQLAKSRAGTHKVKGRSEVNRTNAKVYGQKGSGRARHGSRRVNLFRGGGVTFGPVVRSHSHDINKKVRRAALCSALSVKSRDGQLIVVKNFDWGRKTKDAFNAIKCIGVDHSALLITHDENLDTVRKQVGNLPRVMTLPVAGVNVRDIVRHQHVVVAVNAVPHLVDRLTRVINR